MKIYSIFDGAVQEYLRPFFCRSHAEAVRMFGDTVRDPNNPMNKHPGDYTLFHIGSFDSDSGLLLDETNNSLGNAVEYVEVADESP